MKSAFLKDVQLEALGMFSEVAFGHGHVHYGYWEEPGTEPVEMAELGQAQQAYFDRLAGLIPDGVKTILDVGSGTGSLALGLTQLGYEVDCVCPSSRLNAIARRKLPDSVRLHEAYFEELRTDRRYDLLLFPESFHYIEARAAMARIDELARKHVLICDYFRRRDTKKPKKISHTQFLELLDDETWRVVVDRDITENIAPTFALYRRVSNEYLKPFVRGVFADMKTEMPVLHFFLKVFMGKGIKRVSQESVTYEEFMKRFQYREILLERKAPLP